MTDNQPSRASCGANNPCFPIFTGRRINSGNPPNDGNVCYVLRCSDNRLLRKERTGNGFNWVPMNIPADQRFVFYDVTSESICLINFEQVNPSPITPNGPNGPVAPNGPNDGFTPRPSNGGVVGPVVSAVTRSRPVTAPVSPSTTTTPRFTTGPASTGFVAVNGSMVHSDQDGGHAGGVAADCSLLHSAAMSSMARGTASDRSQVRTGGMPVVKNLPISSKFTVAQVGFGVSDDNTVQAISFDTSNGCADRVSFVNDESEGLRPPLGFFNRKQVLGSFGVEHASGSGHGALASGLSAEQSHLLATADGSLSVGQARCGEVHMAAGLASSVLGRGNRALGAYSQGYGNNALAYMHAQQAQAIPTTINDDVEEGANRIQYTQVPLRGFTTAERIISEEDPDFFTGFELTTLLVLGDTPDNAIIDLEDGPQLDYRRVPFLPVNGTAIVEADVVSTALQTENRRYRLAPFCGKFCFCVTRSGSGHNFSYDILPNTADGDPSIGTICAIPSLENLGLDITAIEFDGQSDGFTVKIVEQVPFRIKLNGKMVPNPRIDPKPRLTEFTDDTYGVPITSKTNFYIQGRIWGGHFRYTEVPEGSSEVQFEAPRNNERVFTVPQQSFGAVNASVRKYNKCKGGKEPDTPLETQLGNTFETPDVSLNRATVTTPGSSLYNLLNPGFGSTQNFGTDNFNGTGLANPVLNQQK
jgi:hypothetical protein